MKKCCVILIFFSCFLSSNVKAQAAEIEQLLLNVEKLNQFKKILENMYDGYKILHQGYNTIKDISEGNFSLHQVFLEGLLEVSPAVKNYKRVADIISCQQKNFDEHKKAFKYFKESGSFSPDEISYMQKVYSNLFHQSLKNLDELVMVITAGTLRMSDDERLGAVDRIFSDMEDKLIFLRSFNNSTRVLTVQRLKEQSEIELSKKISGLK